jgi:hypothetical protein
LEHIIPETDSGADGVASGCFCFCLPHRIAATKLVQQQHGERAPSTKPVPLRKARDSPEPPEQNRKAALGIRLPKSANETGAPGQFELQ